MSIALDLLTWYNVNKRDLVWRHTKKPYYIWISEIMLQQTQVDTVIPYYVRFIERFKSPHDLATASQVEVYKYWEGLGYYSRARNLQTSAQMIVNKFNGQLPNSIEELLSLKGIGPYTANAIGSIAFNLNVFALDGNGLRIISRLYDIEENIALPKTMKQIQSIGDELIKGVNAGDFNQAIMDLGAMICRPKKPNCLTCPINNHCLAYKHQHQDVLPINIKKKNNQDLHYITGGIYYEDKLYLVKNKPDGLLANLYGFKQYEVESPYSFIENFKAETGLDLDVVEHIKDVKHVFSHRTWYMHVYIFKLSSSVDHLYTKKEIDELPISTAHTKVLKSIYTYLKL